MEVACSSSSGEWREKSGAWGEVAKTDQGQIHVVSLAKTVAIDTDIRTTSRTMILIIMNTARSWWRSWWWRTRGARMPRWTSAGSTWGSTRWPLASLAWGSWVLTQSSWQFYGKDDCYGTNSTNVFKGWWKSPRSLSRSPNALDHCWLSSLSRQITLDIISLNPQLSQTPSKGGGRPCGWEVQDQTSVRRP